VIVKYLLPCACGRQIVVEPRQAGQMIPCACGASLQAPTLLDMTALEPAPMISVSPSPPATWGLKSRLRLLGAVLLLLAIGGAAWLYVGRPIVRVIDPEQLQQSARGFSPLQTWTYWEKMKEGLDRRTDQAYAAALLRFRAWEVVVGVVALVGIGLIVVGMVGIRGDGQFTAP
jgi:hypothetical protein